MLKIICFILFIFVYNLYDINIPVDIDFISKKSKNEYTIIYNNYASSYVYKLNLNMDNATLVQEKYFNTQILQFQQLENDLSIYSFHTHAIIINKGINKTVSWDDIYLNRFKVHGFSQNMFLICTSNTSSLHFATFNLLYEDFHLSLI